MARWGKDHWSTFAYVETCWVDHRGMLDADRMRCARSHVAFYGAKRRTTAYGSNVDAARYPTRLKTEQPGSDGRWGTVELPAHDDWNCLDDMIREGLITVTMPRPAPGDVFLDAWDRGVRVPRGELIRPPVTGLTEMWLMAYASFSLTDRGQRIAGQLRAHMAVTRQSHQFVPEG